ncbi:MAG: O-antigen ligase family protein [Bacteroidia bacterium]
MTETAHPLFFKVNPGKVMLFFFLVFPVAVDLLNGFLTFILGLDFSVGVFYRGFLLISSIPVFILHKDKMWKLYVSIIITLWLISCIIWAGTGNLQIIKETMNFVKMLYPFIIIPLIVHIVRKYEVEVDYLAGCAVTYCAIAGGSIIFSLLTGLGIEFSASKYSFGAKSFFVAQNDIGLSMLIGYTLSLYLFFKNFSFKYFIAAVFIMAGLIGLSTRTGIMGAVGVFVFLVVAIMFYGKRSVNINYIAKSFIFLFFALVVTVGTIKVIQLVSEYEYMLTKFQTLAYEHPRQNLFEAAHNRIAGRHWIYNVFGEGMIRYKLEVGNRMIGIYQVSAEGQLAEVDYIDLMGYYGLVMTVLILAFPVYAFLKILILFLMERRFEDMILVLCMTVFLIHSFLAGHAIISPLVSTIMVVIYTCIFYFKKIKFA